MFYFYVFGHLMVIPAQKGGDYKWKCVRACKEIDQIRRNFFYPSKTAVYSIIIVFISTQFYQWGIKEFMFFYSIYLLFFEERMWLSYSFCVMKDSEFVVENGTCMFARQIFNRSECNRISWVITPLCTQSDWCCSQSPPFNFALRNECTLD